MGRADEYQFDYLDDNRRFADQVNGASFYGRQVVKPKELKAIVDKIRMWRGKLIPACDSCLK